MVPTPLQRMRFSPLCYIVSDTHEPRRIDQVDVAGRVETVPEGMDLQILLNNLNSEIETLKAQLAEEEEAQEHELQKAMQHIAGSAAGGTGNVLVPEVDQNVEAFFTDASILFNSQIFAAFLHAEHTADCALVAASCMDMVIVVGGSFGHRHHRCQGLLCDHKGRYQSS